MKSKKKKVLIIGTGMLGAYLSKYLLRKGYNIFVTSRSLKKNYANYSKLEISRKVKFKKLNILKKLEISRIVEHVNPSYIYYFAGISSITKSFLYPKETHESNYLGAKYFLEILEKKN